MAITSTDVTTALHPIIIISPMGDGQKVIDLGDGGFVYVEFFSSLFASAASMAAADLHEVDTANNYGYSAYIDNWKTQGLIN